jgi:pimeloyl-ACP methyl ester carboxylesterase
MDTLLPGISAERVPTSRLTVNVLSVPGRTGPPVLWLRGTDDVIVSDHSLYDLAYLGSIGAIPGWPGEQTWPPQPMLAQTRAVLDGYAAAGGRYREVAIDDAAHGPHLDQPERFLAELGAHLSSA